MEAFLKELCLFARAAYADIKRDDWWYLVSLDWVLDCLAEKTPTRVSPHSVAYYRANRAMFLHPKHTALMTTTTTIGADYYGQGYFTAVPQLVIDAVRAIHCTVVHTGPHTTTTTAVHEPPIPRTLDLVYGYYRPEDDAPLLLPFADLGEGLMPDPACAVCVGTEKRTNEATHVTVASPCMHQFWLCHECRIFAFRELRSCVVCHAPARDLICQGKKAVVVAKE
ncbi:hypothetical protein U1Q18_051632 [Sarracenia purpurea var. burkii]